MSKKKIFLEKSDELQLRSFYESKMPRFYKEINLACQTTEYLLGLVSRCLNKDYHLTFELSLDEEDEIKLDEIISESYRTDISSKIFRLQMKAVYLILLKYYNKDGSSK